MATEKTEGKDKKNSNILIVAVSFLLLVSIAMSVVGMLNVKSEGGGIELSKSEETKIKIEKENEGESLGDMFQKEFSESSKNDGGYDLNDPFREICAPVEGSNPATSSFTVCQPN